MAQLLPPRHDKCADTPGHRPAGTPPSISFDVLLPPVTSCCTVWAVVGATWGLESSQGTKLDPKICDGTSVQIQVLDYTERALWLGDRAHLSMDTIKMKGQAFEEVLPRVLSMQVLLHYEFCEKCCAYRA